VKLILTIILIVAAIVVVNSCKTSEKKIDNKAIKQKSSIIPDKREFPVNNEINPCVNFYDYACSKVIDSFELREDRSHHSFSFNDAAERLLEFKKKYFENLASKKPESAIELEVKNYYLACMNKKDREAEEKKIVSKNIEKLNKIGNKEQFIKMITNNITGEELSFIQFDAGLPNQDKPLYNDLFFNTALMSLPEKSYYEKEDLIKEYRIIIEDFFTIIGIDAPRERAALVFNFEKELTQNYPTPPEVQKLIFSRTQISRDELIKNYPELSLSQFLSNIPKRVHIRNIVGNKTMEFLNNKIKTASLDELKSVYLYFQLKPIMDDAYPEFFKKTFEFNNKYLGGPNKRPDRHERCTTLVMNHFDKEVDFILLPKLFPNFPKTKFIKSVEKIRQAVIAQLTENTWLTDGAKKEAIRKMKKTKLQLVTPNNEEEWDFNPRSSYSVSTPIANTKKLVRLIKEKQLKDLKGMMSPNRWGIGPLTINAYFHPSYNKIVFPVGILQYPFFDMNEPEEVNLAAIGAVIAHELGHSIDNNGNNFNADGLLKPWMTDKDKENFNRKSEYLITQFDKIGHNGKFTLGENIGDLVGLSMAYRAAFPTGNTKSKEVKQKFFLQFARLWCEVERKSVSELRLKIDPHSLGFARANEQMKHQKGFKEAYDCKETDPLVIPEKDIVKIW